MKTIPLIRIALLAALAPLLTHCASSAHKQPAGPTAAAAGKSAPADDLDEYSPATVSDPIEPVNRGTFWVNHQLYHYVFHPISDAYKAVVPKLVRQSLDNVFDNARYPIRVVNNLLQGKPERAGQETAKFFVNSTYGLAGLGRPSDRTPGLEDVPAAETGQTLACWGVPNGPYIVIPILGPSTARDTAGLIGDCALNPLTYAAIFWPYTWFVAIPTTNNVRALPRQMEAYDAASGNALDRYLAVRTGYIQYRAAAAAR